MTIKPQRDDHDCEQCEYLGQYNEFDLYYCTNSENESSEVTLLARWDSEPSQYTCYPKSMLENSPTIIGKTRRPPIREALRLYQSVGELG